MVSWLGRIWRRSTETNLSLLAAAVAFYMMLSLFPALTTLISAYGLIADPQSVARQLDLMRGVLPQEALVLMNQEIDLLLSKTNSTLGIGVIVGALLTLWSARSGATAVMAALNAIYREPEKRGLVRQQLVALALTAGGIATMIAAVIAIAIIPAVLQFVPFAQEIPGLLFVVRWPTITAVVIGSFGLIYRFAPCRQQTAWPAIGSGAACAAILWMGGSALFSIYVTSLGSYDRVYGSIGAVVVLLIWLYVSALALLIGAAVDAELNPPGKKTSVDRT